MTSHITCQQRIRKVDIYGKLTYMAIPGISKRGVHIYHIMLTEGWEI